MKKSLILSLLLHAAILSLMLFLVRGNERTGTPPFFTRLVSPEEIAGGGHAGDKKSPAIRPKVKVNPRPPAAGLRPIQRNRTGNLSERPGIERKPEAGADQEIAPGRETSTIPPGSASSNGITRDTPGGEGGGRGKEPKSPFAPKSLKEMLNDPEIIGKLSRSERPEQDAGITFDTKEYKYYGYMQRLREKIEGAWNYPSEAAERGIYGDLVIRFSIKKDGKLGAVELVRTSGHKELDDAAMRALRAAEPYWPLPDEWDREAMTITGHFIYTLYGTHIR